MSRKRDKSQMQIYKCHFCGKRNHLEECEKGKSQFVLQNDQNIVYYCKSNCYAKNTNFLSVSSPKFKINDFIKIKGSKLYGFVIEVITDPKIIRHVMAENGIIQSTAYVPYQSRKKYSQDHIHRITPYYRLHLNIFKEESKWELHSYEYYIKTKEGYCNENQICFVKSVK